MTPPWFFVGWDTRAMSTALKILPSAVIATSVAAFVYYALHAAATGVAGSLAMSVCVTSLGLQC